MSNSSSNPPRDRSGTVVLAESEFHRLLASKRRRILLEILDERPPPIDLEALALAVAERESGTESERPADVHRVAITLHHQHLPALSDGGVLEYRPAANRVDSFDGVVR
ncbi:DUF7344 domain-containing protein [Natrononativus amylolyticus]|uniref:DUF7344 domain-containing protein n=1 Tax=Natrononativus amylolyticus TaxID=2963434 RepID=UPI0020CD31CF|nr:hypothetical protein [Natrononativus amylolyticus]